MLFSIEGNKSWWSSVGSLSVHVSSCKQTLIRVFLTVQELCPFSLTGHGRTIWRTDGLTSRFKGTHPTSTDSWSVDFSVGHAIIKIVVSCQWKVTFDDSVCYILAILMYTIVFFQNVSNGSKLTVIFIFWESWTMEKWYLATPLARCRSIWGKRSKYPTEWRAMAIFSHWPDT